MKSAPTPAAAPSSASPGAWILALLLLAFFAVFLIYPVGLVLREAFVVEGRLSLRYFSLLLANPLVLQALAHSFLLATLTTSFTTLLCLPLALLFHRCRFPGQSLLSGLLLVPMVMPPFVGAIGLRQLFARYGSINLALIDLGWMDPAQPVDWLGDGGFWGIVILQVFNLYPVLLLNLGAALASVDPSLHEAAQNLGASRLRLFRTITLPLILPGWFAGAIIVFLWSFTDLGTPLIFGYSAVVPVQIFDAITDLHTNPMGYVLVVVVVALTLGTFLASKSLFASRSYASLNRGPVAPPQPASTLRTCLAWSLGGAVVLAGLLPHLAVLLQSVSGPWFFSVLPSHLTHENFTELTRQPAVAQSLQNSLLYSSASAALDLGLGVAIAWLLTRRRLPLAGLLDLLAMLPLAVPGLVIAFGYVAAFDLKVPWLNPRENPTLLLIIGYAVRRLPYIVRSATAGFQQTSVTLEEASASLGASPWTTLRRITLPLILASLIAGTILTFALAMLEVSDGLILAMKESHYPITKMIWAVLGRIEPASTGVACALGVVGMLILAACLLTANRLLGRRLGTVFRA